MSDEDAFIRALRERPDDETTRLVYADWLDDRSDPRAEYLRVEAAWVALQPSDEQYRPLYRRVSQLAAALEPEWFATVSRMGPLVRRWWEPVAPVFTPEEPAPASISVVSVPLVWANAVGRIRDLLAKSFGESEIERRFCVPADFAAFYCLVDGMSDGWNFLLGSEGLVTSIATNVQTYQPGQAAPDYWSDEEIAERPKNPGIWLEFGGWSDKHWYSVCCDLDSSLFGVIAEAHDYHPWMAGSEGMDYRGRNFLHFLSGYLPYYQDRESLDEWPRVPHAEWPTH